MSKTCSLRIFSDADSPGLLQPGVELLIGPKRYRVISCYISSHGEPCWKVNLEDAIEEAAEECDKP